MRHYHSIWQYIMVGVRVTELGLLGCGVRTKVRFMELGL